MELIADILLVAGALGAGLYCFVLSRRLRKFTDLEQGVGGAVAVLSSQADALKRSLESARSASDQSGVALKDLTQRAESVAGRLELMMASMHDIVPDEDNVGPGPEDPEPGEAETENSAIEPAVDSETPAPQGPTKQPDTEKHEDFEVAPQPKGQPEGLMFFRHARKSGEATP